MSNLKKEILNKEWTSQGSSWTIAPEKKTGVTPRYGTVFTCVDANPIVRKDFMTKSHWKDNEKNEWHKLTKGPRDIVIPCVRFQVFQPDLPNDYPPPEDDWYDPPQEKLDSDFLRTFESTSFRVEDTYLIAPMVEILLHEKEYKATMIITFDKNGTMTLKSFWSDEYFGGYCCP